MGEMVGSKCIFPIVEGSIENPTSLVTYSVCSNGIFVTKKVAGRGTVTTKIEGIKGLPEGKEEINILPRKIPCNYLWEIINFFRYIGTSLGKAEAYILLGYNFDTDSFKLYVPKQEVSGASVKYDIEMFWKDNPGYYCILDAHLHPNFSAFWSGTDDNDDKRDRYSMVIGNQNNIMPDCLLRFASGKKHINFKLDDLFEMTTEHVNFDYVKEASKVKIRNESNTGYTYSQKSLYDAIKFNMKNGTTLKDLIEGTV